MNITVAAATVKELCERRGVEFKADRVPGLMAGRWMRA
jgi:hypothetical protein